MKRIYKLWTPAQTEADLCSLVLCKELLFGIFMKTQFTLRMNSSKYILGDHAYGRSFLLLTSRVYVSIAFKNLKDFLFDTPVD